MNSWNVKLAHCLELGTADASILVDLDDMLSWYSSTSKEKDELRESLTKKYSDVELSVRFEEFLDRMVVSDAAAGEMFHPSLSADVAKKRYRQLIRIFHPDRGAKEEVWLNYRAERVNKAYKTYQQAGTALVGQIDPMPTPAPKARAANATGKQRPAVKFTYRPNIWRQRLGSAKDVQRKMIFGLVGFSSLLLLIFLAPSMQKDQPANNVDSGEQLTLRPDIETGAVQIDQAIPELSQSSLNVLNDAKWLDEEAVAESDLDLELERERELEARPAEQSTAQKILSKYKAAERKLEAMKANPIEDERAELALPEPVVEEKSSQQTPNNTIKQPDTTIAANSNQAEIKPQPIKPLAKAEAKPATSVCSEPRVSQLVSASAQQVELLVESFIRVGPDLDCQHLKHLSKNTQLTKLGCTADGFWCFVQEGAQTRADQSGWVKANQLGPRSMLEETEAVSVAKIVEPEKAAPTPVSSIPRAASAVLSPTVDIEPAAEETEHASEPSLNLIVSNIFSSYKQYFESGDHERLAGLFMSSARENKMRGIDAISNYYRRAFKTTYNRDFDIYLESLDTQDESSAVAKGRLIVAADFNRSGKRDRNQAEFRMVFLKVDGKYKIAVFEWKRA